MATNTCKITIHMVSSVDGYIAKKDNSVSWFETADHYEKGTTDADAATMDETADCYVMGARTYEHALELSKNYGWVYGDVPTIVLSHRNLPIERQNVEIYPGDLNKLVEERLKPNFRNVWAVGGAALTKALLRLQLADEIRQVILPVILGDGLPFYDHVGQERALHLKNVTAYKTGMVEICYEIKKSGD